MRALLAIEILLSYIKLILIKFIYFNKVRIKNLFSVFMRKGCTIYLSGKLSKLEIKGKLVCRNNVSFDIRNGQLSLGSANFFNRDCSIVCRGSIKIGNDCLFGESVKIYDHNHRRITGTLFKNSGYDIGEIVIGNNVWIGSNVVILKDVHIGDNVIIAAGSVIRSDIPDNHLAYIEGNTVIKKLD